MISYIPLNRILRWMNATLPPDDVILALERISGGKLTRHRDLATLIDLSRRAQCGDLLADLSFHAKFVANSSRTLTRIGPDAESAQALSAEMQKELETVRTLAGQLLAHGPEEQRTAFEETYFRLTPEALQNCLALCYDLSWYKNWLLDTSPNRIVKKPSSAVWRGALIVLVIGAVFWLGSVNTRAILANNLLVGGTLSLDTTLPAAVEQQIYREWSGLGIVMIAGYVLVLAAGIVFLIRSPFRLRDHGWLMMSAILLFLFVPVEVYVMVLDVRMILMAFTDGGTLPAFRELFLARLSALGGAPLVAVLCYYTIIALAVIQPFRRQSGASR